MYQRFREGRQTDLTAMMDVLLLLCAFFMVTTTIEVQKVLGPPAIPTIPVYIPHGDHLFPRPVELTVLNDNEILLGGDVVQGHNQLVSAIEEEMAALATTEILIVTDPDSTHEMTIAALDAARDAGILEIQQFISR